jgi:SAM-dependent methyltransferase
MAFLPAADAPDYSAVQPIYDAMRTEQILGKSVTDIAGGGDPFDVAVRLVGLIQREAGLNPSDHVLDLGCGCGRIAALLTKHLAPTSRYIGLDIVPGLIDFCDRHIAARNGNFRFATVAMANGLYDKYRNEAAGDPGVAPDDVMTECGRGSIDLAVATSLFSHLGIAATRAYLASIRRVLKPDGRIFATFFLMDGGVRALLRQNPARMQFRYRAWPRRVYFEKLRHPAHTVAYRLDLLADLAGEAGFTIDRIRFGRWPGRPNGPIFQGVVVLRPSGGARAAAPR